MDKVGESHDRITIIRPMHVAFVVFMRDLARANTAGIIKANVTDYNTHKSYVNMLISNKFYGQEGLSVHQPEDICAIQNEQIYELKQWVSFFREVINPFENHFMNLFAR